MAAWEITQGQKRFFETFGYVVFKGLFADGIREIQDEFAQVFVDKGVAHDDAKRSCIVPFIDQRERLCGLLDDSRITAIGSGLLGDGFNYLGSDGNYYTGDTGWHSDGFHHIGQYMKIAFYLDPVQRDSGALRVFPGSHRPEIEWEARRAGQARELWDIDPREVPTIALESEPGDVVAFNHNLMHAAFGGSTRRRMFTLNLCRRCETTEEIAELEAYIDSHDRFWIDHMYSDLMRDTASAQRMRHLEQVMAHEGHLPELSARARATMTEASRG